MRFLEPHNETIFADFIHTVDIEVDLEGIESALRQEREDIQFGRDVSNIGGYHSKTHYQSTKVSEPVEKLVKGVVWYSSKILKDIDEKLRVRDFDWWFIMNARGNYNEAHSHGNTSLTAVFYVAAPENCGDLVLMRTDGGLYNGVIRKTTHTVTPKAGRLVLFPAHLVHYVQPSETDEERISMAFNIYTL